MKFTEKMIDDCYQDAEVEIVKMQECQHVLVKGEESGVVYCVCCQFRLEDIEKWRAIKK